LATVIIWDEAPITHRWALEAIDRTLRDIRGEPHKALGGVVFVLMGGFRQTLPVIPRANCSQIVGATFKRSTELWPQVQRHALQKNMRVEAARAHGDGAAAAEIGRYAKFLLDMGNGALPALENTDLVEIPAEHLLPATGGVPAGLKDLIAYTYGDVPLPVPAPSDEERDPRTDEYAAYQARVLANARYFQDKALLTPKNKEAEDMNGGVLRGMPGEEHVLFSDDSIAPGGEYAANYPVEFLNSLNLSGLPLHEVKLKVPPSCFSGTSIRAPASATAPASSSPPSTLISSRVP